MAIAILGIIEAALSIWESKLRQKYIDKVADLKLRYYAEVNKPREEQSDAAIDNIEFELKVMAQALAADMKLAGKA